MKIIKHSKRIHCVKYTRSFEWADGPGSGFGFDCDEQGNVIEAVLTDMGLENYRKCLDGTYNVVDKGVETYCWSYTECAIGLCQCGREVDLDGFTNTCESCERDYNMSGQELAPREFWGEDTNESLSDILNIH